jgi:hypothetical protein
MESDVLLTTMEQELRRGQAELAKQDPAPYFTSYTISDNDSLLVIGFQGSAHPQPRMILYSR